MMRLLRPPATRAHNRTWVGPAGPTGATHASHPPHNRRRYAARAVGGFTLIEILVVVVIIGVLSAGLLLSITLTGRDRDLEKEGDRLLALLNYAREQSELQTREYGLIFQDDSYEFVSYDVHRGVWRSVFEDDALALRKLPYGLDVKLIVEARPVVLKKPTDAKDKTPQVMIFSSGDLTSFEVTLEREGGVRSITIVQDDKGNIIEKPMVDTTVKGNKA
ncbi:MAG: type II secretion system minor pseudopilin GspH [Steroidobacteraceae bacterium]